MGARVALLVLVVLAAVPGEAWALAGGAKGSGGGGGSSGGGGGYSSSGGGGGGKITLLAVLLGLGFAAAIFLIPFILRRLRGSGGGSQATPARRLLVGRRARKAEEVAKAANAGDGYWDPADLKRRVEEGFYPIQSSWSQRGVSPSRPYLSDELYQRHELQLEGLERQHRVNRIADLALDKVEIVRVVNVTDDSKDRFVAFIECRARDWMEDTATGEVVNGNPSAQTTFQQYWSFSCDPIAAGSSTRSSRARRATTTRRRGTSTPTTGLLSQLPGREPVAHARGEDTSPNGSTRSPNSTRCGRPRICGGACARRARPVAICTGARHLACRQ
jgi:inner membrane protein import complex subunit Tim44-like protein